MTIQEMVDAINSPKNCSFSFFCKLEELTDQNNTKEAIKCVKDHFNCDEEIATQVFNEYKDRIYAESKRIENENPLTSQQIAHNNMVARESLNKPKCPTCSSTKVKRISGTAKVTGAVAFGLFSKTARSQFKCENCGYKW